MSTVRVLTLNIWNREGPWPKRRQLLRHWLNRLRPDLIAIQEAKDSDQLGELFDPGYHTEWMGTEQSGIAIVSRWPLNGRTEYSLQGDGATWSRTNDFARESLLPSRRIDYIFVGHPRMSDGAGLVESCAVVCNERADEIWPSDHFGVFAELQA